jgi:peptide-methionine (S)-S-oxide reductase
MAIAGAHKEPIPAPLRDQVMPESGWDADQRESAVFAGGCFWGVQSVFQRVKGVENTTVGYSGGARYTADYRTVSTGTTGHAEAIEIVYDPAKVSYGTLLRVFFSVVHDPTQMNRQGNDIGTQYRSIILYHDEEQKGLAESYKAKLEAEHIWNRTIVTEIVPCKKFWPGEDYHQNYYNSNPGKGYCTLVITPKLDKFTKIFKDRLRQK